MLTDETIIDATFDDLLNGPHAVVVHESPENFDTFVACGELGGVVSDGELQIGLRPLNASRYYGVAVLEKDEGTPLIGEDKTKVTVYVFQDVGPAGPLGPGMTPAAEEASRPTATPTR